MKHLTYSILILAVLYLAGGQSLQIAEDGQDEPPSFLNSQPTTQKEETTTTPPTTAKPSMVAKANKSLKKAKGDTAGLLNKLSAVVCPEGCNCEEKPKKLKCRGVKAFPDLSDWNGLTSIDMKSCQLENVDFNSLLSFKDSLESLDLSGSSVKSFSVPPSKKDPTFSKLRTLLLNNNSLSSIGKLSIWKLPALETIDLSMNPLVEFVQSDFNNTKNLQNLNIQNLKMKLIHEQAFLPLSQLKALNMSGTKLENHLGDKQFAGNQKLEIVDLSDNNLIEVPFALRSTNSIIKLILNSNNMTSLRQSDFINRTKLTDLEIRRCPKLSKIDDFAFSDLTSLERLVISDNFALNSISSDAFKPSLDKATATDRFLDIFDIRNNNLTTLSNPLEFSALAFKQLLLSGNPWHCDCNLRWFNQFSSQARPLAHCKSPAQFMDIEIGESLSTIDCETVDSIFRTVVVTGFFLFLFILVVLVAIQKSDIVRRFLWKDQYGTIYYTKASFPPETI